MSIPEGELHIGCAESSGIGAGHPASIRLNCAPGSEGLIVREFPKIRT
jgi:hypothetical protein